MKKILIADDAEFNRDVLKEIFCEQYEIMEAANGQEAIDIIQRDFEKISLLFLDLVMPVKSGIDVLEYMKEYGYLGLIPVIMITGEATNQTDAKAYEYGVSDIIYKPFSRRVVTRRALNIMELFERRRTLAIQLDQTTTELKETQQKLERNNEFLVNALSSVIEYRSLENGSHLERVKRLTNLMIHTWSALHPAEGLTEYDMQQITLASALHDIGKISIPDEIVMNTGRLEPEEIQALKQHTVNGCEILERFKQEDNDFYKYCYEICRWHHERYDGKGYPDGLQGEEIPVWAQIVAVADTFDNLISPSVYTSPYSIPKAIDMILAGKCGVFSPEILACLQAAKFGIIKIAEQ